jgi:hypothetical protein
MALDLWVIISYDLQQSQSGVYTLLGIWQGFYTTLGIALGKKTV